MSSNKSNKQGKNQQKQNTNSGAAVGKSQQTPPQVDGKSPSNTEKEPQKIFLLTSAIIMGVSFVLLMLALISSQISSKTTDYKDFESAKADFGKKCCKDSSWFVPQSVSSPVRLAVDVDSSQLLVINGTNCQAVRYTSSTNDIKNADKEAFSAVLSKCFPKLKIHDTLSASQIAQSLGADTTYLSAVAAEKNLSAEDVAFSLIYNTIVGDAAGHSAVTVENSKLVKKHSEPFSMLKQNRFVEIMNMYQNSDSLDSLILSGAVDEDCRFVYWDVRNDKLRIGDESYSLSDATSRRYLPQLKARPTEIFYLCGDQLCTLQATDSWGMLDKSKIQKPEKGFFASLLKSLQSTSSLIVLCILFFGSCICLVVMLARKRPTQVVENNIIKKIIIFVKNISDTMKPNETPLNDVNSEDNRVNVSNLQVETQTGPNQYVFENLPRDEEGLLKILEGIDSKEGTKWAEGFRQNQKECDGLREENKKLERDIRNKKTDIAQWDQKLNEANLGKTQLQNSLDMCEQRLSETQKKLQTAEKKRKEAEDKYDTVSQWMPYLEKTRQILTKVGPKIANLPIHEGSDAWGNLRIAVLSHAALMELLEVWLKLLEVWLKDESWRKRMKALSFRTEMENEMLMLEKLKQSVNALCLTGKLKNSKDIDAEVAKKVKEGYDQQIALTPNPQLDDVLNKSINARVAFEQNKPFMDAMWNNFVQEFINGDPVQKGKAWYFEHLINIAYHAADYISMQQGMDKSFCPNYQFLESHFNPKNSEVRPFEYRHAEKSSQKSNTIYEWTSEMGIEHLRVLIEKYLIKP